MAVSCTDNLASSKDSAVTKKAITLVTVSLLLFNLVYVTFISYLFIFLKFYYTPPPAQACVQVSHGPS